MSDEPPTGGTGKEPSRKSSLIGLTTALLAILGVVVSSYCWLPRQQTPGPAPVQSALPNGALGPEHFARYVGAAVCSECHPGEAALQARSGHSKTLWKTATRSRREWFISEPFRDPEQPDVEWLYQQKNGVVVVNRSQGGRTQSIPLEFGVGSGNHGVTFVTTRSGAEASSSLGPTGIEHRISYTSATRTHLVTPGQTAGELSLFGPTVVPEGRLLTPEQMRECFSCHATVTSTSASNRLDVNTLVPNVTCERCHGPGREHVEAVRRGESDLKVLSGLDRDEPARQINLCGECHRTVRVIAGPKLNPENREIVRYQPVGLSLSACYAKATSGLKCTSCHDPHARASTERVAYNAVCVSCHHTTKQRVCPRSPRVGCIDCHMPRREMPGGAVFTDHWIRIRSQPPM